MKTRVLFICTANKDRSRTAEALCRDEPYLEAGSAGTSKYARTPLSEELIRAADVLVVMEEAHAEQVRRRFPLAAGGKPLHCLDIPDEYTWMEPDLVAVLRERLRPLLAEWAAPGQGVG